MEGFISIYNHAITLQGKLIPFKMPSGAQYTIKSPVKSLQATWKSGALVFHCSNILLTSSVMYLNNFQRILLQQEAVVSGSQVFLSSVSSNLELGPLFFLSETEYIL